MCTVQRNIELAAKIARETDNGMRYKLCAIICRKRHILSIGINRHKTHTQATDNGRGHRLHAELAAILNCNREALVGSTLYVVRVGKNNQQSLRMSKPCSYCQTAIIKAGIKTVYFSTAAGEIRCWDVRHNQITFADVG